MMEVDFESNVKDSNAFVEAGDLKISRMSVVESLYYSVVILIE